MTAPTARIARFSLTSADPARLAGFYAAAFGFRPVGIERRDAEPYGVAGGATVHGLRLDGQEIELVGFDRPGAPYPADGTSHDAWFQHLALVVDDIAAACAHLAGIPGWRPITTGGGPVTLPAASGGVGAFKFRDPEGHPLEFLFFPPDKAPPAWQTTGLAGPCIGIDHSAIVVADAARSIAHYEGLGLRVAARSLNQGPEQDALDGAAAVTVGVTGLSAAEAPPHLELLAYRNPAVRPGRTAPNDVACTRTVFEGGHTLVTDPDGHRAIVG